MSKSIEQRVEISEECRLATAELPARWDKSASVASITLGNVGYCDIGQHNTLLPICSLNKIKLKHGIVFEKTPDLPDEASTTDLGQAVFNLRESLDSLAGAMQSLDEQYERFLADFARVGYPERTELAKLSRSKALSIAWRMRKVRADQLALRREIAALVPAIETQAYIELRAWDANLHAQLAQLERLLSGDVSMVLRDGLRDQVLTHVAQRSLELLHGALKAPTAVINRLDNQGYGVVSVGYLVLGPNLQDAIDRTFDKIKETYAKRIAKEKGSTAPDIKPFLGELRRAACNRLLSGTEFSMLSELVDTMLIRQIGVNRSSGRKVEEALPQTFNKVQQNPFYPEIVINAAHGVQDQQVRLRDSPKVSPLAVYATNQWAARQQLLEQTIREKIQSGAIKVDRADQTVFDVDTVDSSAVERLAQSATAQVVDDATRQYPALLENTEGMSNLLAANVNVATAASAVSTASVVLDVNISVANTNTFSPTNHNHVAPVFNLAATAAPIPPLCASVDFARIGAMCFNDGNGYVITFARHFFASDSCRADDLAPALSDVARHLSGYARRHGLQYDVAVEGHASHPAAKMAMCKPAQQPAKARCSYRNKLYNAVDIAGCRTAGGERNLQLSAARARNAAEVIEQVGNGAIVVRQITAHGAQLAQAQDKTAQAADQTIVLRLRQQGVAMAVK